MIILFLFNHIPFLNIEFVNLYPIQSMYSNMSLLINSIVSVCSGLFFVVLITRLFSKIFLISVSTVDTKLSQLEPSFRDCLTTKK